MLEFLKAADLSGKLFYLIVEHVQHLHVLKVGNVWRYGYQREKQRKCKNYVENTTLRPCQFNFYFYSLESHSKHKHHK